MGLISLQVFANAVYRSRTQTLLAEVDPYFSFDCGVSTDLFDRRLSLFKSVVRPTYQSVSFFYLASNHNT